MVATLVWWSSRAAWRVCCRLTTSSSRRSSFSGSSVGGDGQVMLASRGQGKLLMGFFCVPGTN